MSFPITLPPSSTAGIYCIVNSWLLSMVKKQWVNIISSGVSDLSASSTSTISALLSSSSIPSIPNNPIVAHQLIIDDTIPIVDASILPVGYLEACIATSQVEYITPTPVILSNFPYQWLLLFNVFHPNLPIGFNLAQSAIYLTKKWITI